MFVSLGKREILVESSEKIKIPNSGNQRTNESEALSHSLSTIHERLIRWTLLKLKTYPCKREYQEVKKINDRLGENTYK